MGVVVLKQVATYRREQDLHLCGGISGGCAPVLPNEVPEAPPVGTSENTCLTS